MAQGDGLDAETRDAPDDVERASAPRRLTLTLLHHADPRRVGERAFVAASKLELSRASPSFVSPSGERPLLDSFISRNPTTIAIEGSSVKIARANGASPIEVNGTPIESSTAVRVEELESGVVLNIARRAVALLHWSFDERREADDFGLVGESAALHRVRREIKRLAPLQVPILIRGATGTGKELAAHAIHAMGAKSSGPFVAVNVAGLAPAIASSELFGHAKGAFTGAVGEHAGHFVRADGGTLFLDEIGEASLEIQALLLRTLETSIVQPVGGTSERRVDVRLVTATDADLEAAVARGTFREALLHRLSGFVMRMPRLAARREDLGRLLVSFMAREAENLGATLETGDEDRPWLPADVVATLALYDWPGNIRQLRNVARQLLIARDEGAEVLADVARELTRPVRAEEAPARATSTAPSRKPADVPDEEVMAALEKSGWRLERAASALGISRTSLYRRIEKIPELKKSKDLTIEQINDALAQSGGDVERAARSLKVSEAGLRLRIGAQSK